MVLLLKNRQRTLFLFGVSCFRFYVLSLITATWMIGSIKINSVYPPDAIGQDRHTHCGDFFRYFIKFPSKIFSGTLKTWKAGDIS